MTGATLIAIAGPTAYLVKVRTDGDDIHDLIPPHIYAGQDPKKLCELYLADRAAGMDSSYLSEQLPPHIVKFSTNGKTSFEDLLNEVEAILTATDPAHDYLCSYEDHCMLVDTVAGTYTVV